MRLQRSKEELLRSKMPPTAEAHPQPLQNPRRGEGCRGQRRSKERQDGDRRTGKGRLYKDQICTDYYRHPGSKPAIGRIDQGHHKDSLVHREPHGQSTSGCDRLVPLDGSDL